MILSSGTEQCKFSHGLLSHPHIPQPLLTAGLETPNSGIFKVKEDFAAALQDLDNKEIQGFTLHMLQFEISYSYDRWSFANWCIIPVEINGNT